MVAGAGAGARTSTNSRILLCGRRSRPQGQAAASDWPCTAGALSCMCMIATAIATYACIVPGRARGYINISARATSRSVDALTPL